MAPQAIHRFRLTSKSRSFTFSSLAVLTLSGLAGCDGPVLDQLPLRVALDYVQRHPEYVIADVIANPDDQDILDSELPHGADAELDRHLAGDWVARTLREYDEADAEDRISWAWRSVELTRATMLSQREPELYLLADDCLCDEAFADAAFARLVRGFSNCDGVNHVLAMLLRMREPDTLMYTLDDSPDGKVRGGHTLTAMPGDGGHIFVDAWADFGVMVLSEATAAGVPVWGELGSSDAPDHSGLYAWVQYALGYVMPDTEVYYGRRYEEGVELRVPEDLPAVADARGAYLRARVFDLYGLEEEAVGLYEQAAEMGCGEPMGAVCQLSRAWLRRKGVVWLGTRTRRSSRSPAAAPVEGSSPAAADLQRPQQRVRAVRACGERRTK